MKENLLFDMVNLSALKPEEILNAEKKFKEEEDKANESISYLKDELVSLIDSLKNIREDNLVIFNRNEALQRGIIFIEDRLDKLNSFDSDFLKNYREIEELISSLIMDTRI